MENLLLGYLEETFNELVQFIWDKCGCTEEEAEKKATNIIEAIKE